MDESALERAKAGDREALEELLAELAPLVHRFGSRMCRHEADAEDVVQDTLLSVASHLEDFEGRSSLSSWVFALARTACARKRRGLKHQPHLPEDAAGERATAEGAGPDAAFEQRELRTKLEAALASLSEEHREVLLLRDVEGLTAPEVAEALGTSVDAVKSRLHRARAALRDAFLPAGVDARPGPSCPDIVAALSRKADGDLEPCDCEKLDEHLASCPHCGASSAALRSALGACRAISKGPVPEEVRARVLAALRELPKNRL